MNVYEKLSKARIKLQSTTIKKSGYNSGLKFNYMELEDFLPHINTINDEIGIIAVFNIDDLKARLTIINVEKPDESIEFSSHTAQAKLQGAANPVQELGSQHTYLRRYLYLMGYEISEHDTLDPTIGQTPEVKAETKPLKAQTKATTPQPVVTPVIYITDDQAVSVSNQCAETESNIKEVMQYFSITTLDKMTAQQFAKFEKMMVKKREQKEPTT